uniref:UDP-galactose transporter n=1 Tax=Caenorhabditis japonica TaxID=281687 RepID=A0A8R1DYX1_CAEJA
MSSSGNDSKFKYFGILFLTIQQASMPLMARYSRARENSNVFFTTVNVFLMEIIKVVLCSVIIIYSNKSVLKYFYDLKSAIVDHRSETLKVCIPALIYTLQNNLYYIALSHLEATTFCITYQMKIFTTAIFMYFFLGKKLSAQQWWALALLVIGVADIQYIYSPPPANEEIDQNPMYGFAAVLTMCFTSAFAGVYLEKVLKSSNSSIWVQNIRLSLIGLPISFISMWYYDWNEISEQGAFRGWDIVVVCLTATNSIGGILISVVMKYADNILKAYAQSMAIIGAAVGSWILFDFAPGFLFLLGTAMVIASIIIYTAFPYQQPESKISEFLRSQNNSSLLMIRPRK